MTSKIQEMYKEATPILYIFTRESFLLCNLYYAWMTVHHIISTLLMFIANGFHILTIYCWPINKQCDTTFTIHIGTYTYIAYYLHYKLSTYRLTLSVCLFKLDILKLKIILEDVHVLMAHGYSRDFRPIDFLQRMRFNILR